MILQIDMVSLVVGFLLSLGIIMLINKTKEASKLKEELEEVKRK